MANLIEVKASDVTAHDIEVSVDEALQRHAHSLARNLHIHFEQGLATISGLVDSEAQKDMVLAAARSVPGVSRVEEHVRIGS